MTEIQTAEDVREQAEVLHTGNWYIAELDDPQIAVQGESEGDAIEQLVKRWREYTTEEELPGIPLDELPYRGTDTDKFQSDKTN